MKKVYLLQLDIDQIKATLDEMVDIIKDSACFEDYGRAGHLGVGEFQTYGEFLDWVEDVKFRLDKAEGP